MINQKPRLELITSQKRTEPRQNKPKAESIAKRYAMLNQDQKRIIDGFINVFLSGSAA